MLSSNEKKVALKRFGQRLAELRKQKNLSLREMASACDIDNSKISKIEKGKSNITFTTIIDLARGLEVHPRQLFDYPFEG